MDTSHQLAMRDATGWKRGLYEDIQSTFDAPMVNWTFRTLMANYPEFTRVMWGRLKPLFRTAAFADFTLRYRDLVLTGFEDATRTRTIQPDETALSPNEYRELCDQMATFDTVAPRLTVLLDVLDRELNREDHTQSVPDTRSATAPYPEWLDDGRGSKPTMIPFGTVPDDVEATLDDVVTAHGFDAGLPSIYRCLAQWPSYLRTAWERVGPVVGSDDIAAITGDVSEAVDSFTSRLPYRPNLSPDALRRDGFSDGTVADLQSFVREFNRDPIESVVPVLPMYAHLVGAAGPRTVL